MHYFVFCICICILYFVSLQVELKVMQLLGGAEAVPEDILRILEQVKFLENKTDDFFYIDQIRQAPLKG